MKNCPFCNWPDVPDLRDRVFYHDRDWFAFLDAPYHTRGHVVVAAQRKGIHCPNEIEQVPVSLGPAITLLVSGLRKYCAELTGDALKDILIASLRGDIPHFHIHLIPLWRKEELKWRLDTGHERGRLMTFLGYLENRRDEHFRQERTREGWSEEEQRQEIAKRLQGEVKKLKEIKDCPA